MYTYTPTTEKAKTIRQELKQLGYNNKKVSVRCDGGSINVTLKFIPNTEQVKEVKKVAEKFEKIHYDEATGEILSGGNTFVFVEYPRNEEELKRQSRYLY